MDAMRSGRARFPVFGMALGLLLGCVSPGVAWSQWSHNRGYQLLQRVDDVLFGVDNLALQILDRRYVAGTLVRINAQRPSPVRGLVGFVADCQLPLRIAILDAAARKSPPVPAELEFEDVAMLDGSWAAAEFACASTRQPGRAAQLARDWFERGGPADMQTVYCELQPDGGHETRAGVEVRFSPSANAVAVNRQWLSSGSVTDTEVRFGVNSKWHIDREALNVRRSAANGEMLFSGACDRRPPAAALR